MNPLILQLQLLLAALAALLPLVPAAHRARIGALLDLVAQVLRAGDRAGAVADDLAARLARVRADVEALAASGATASADRIEEAFARVASASRAFRAAMEEPS